MRLGAHHVDRALHQRLRDAPRRNADNAVSDARQRRGPGRIRQRVHGLQASAADAHDRRDLFLEHHALPVRVRVQQRRLHVRSVNDAAYTQ